MEFRLVGTGSAFYRYGGRTEAVPQSIRECLCQALASHLDSRTGLTAVAHVRNGACD